VIANALDNISARLYIDGKTVSARVPLLDSGTLGPKGHVQVIVPYETESYGELQDLEDVNAIPQCTLKMFPEETLHCVEWAKDLFGNLFTLKPQNFNKVFESDIDTLDFANMQEVTNIGNAVKMANKAPRNFDHCVELARIKF